MRKKVNDENRNLLDERGAANLLNLSVRTLQRWRSKGIGPQFVRLSTNRCVRYARSDLMNWLEGRSVPTTTGQNKRKERDHE